MSRETQIPQRAINEMARDLGIPVLDLHRMLKLGNEIGPYEEGLNQEWDHNTTLSSIRREIERKGSIGGEQVG